jgi:hypothetical protein
MKPQAMLTSVAAGVDGLRGNVLRTLLSALGVLIGVASLVGVLSLGDGMERSGRSSRGTPGPARAPLARGARFRAALRVHLRAGRIPGSASAPAAPPPHPVHPPPAKHP